MSITLTKEKHFIVLLSIFDLKGKATKKQVLDNIKKKEYYLFLENDVLMKSNRPELIWRNDLAFVRKQLVDKGYINDSIRDSWVITETGIKYLGVLHKIVLSTEENRLKKISSNAIKRSLDILNKSSEELDWQKNNLIEDEMLSPNETQETIIKRIKRYKKIVDELKQKYNGYCQIENCKFTSLKFNGENYSEAHHLIPLAKGGSQSHENVVILCANHHRMFHYAKIEIEDMQSKYKRQIYINNEEFFLIYKD